MNKCLEKNVAADKLQQEPSRRHNTQHNDTQPYNIQHNDTQHKDTHHNDIRHINKLNAKYNDTQDNDRALLC
jgi:hypothetical protein